MTSDDFDRASTIWIKFGVFCEFIIDKPKHKIVYKSDDAESIEQDVTNTCVQLDLEHKFNKQNNIFYNYNIGTILAKILNSEVDTDCIEFLENTNFDVEFY